MLLHTKAAIHIKGCSFELGRLLQIFSRMLVIWWSDLGHSFFHSKNQVTNALVCQSSKTTEIERFHWMDELLGSSEDVIAEY